jgi:predicted PhzF superfamily epimerase YddE/YHI9
VGGAREHPGLEIVRVFCAEDGTGGNPLGVFLDGAAVPEDYRQPIAAELNFSETVFVDDPNTGRMRIFTPTSELPLAGHPLVGTAWLLREAGMPPAALRPPAGEVPVRFEDGLACVQARPEWCPPFEWVQLESPEAVDSIQGPPEGWGLVGMWAWLDEYAGVVRARVFCPAEGIPEDEATGSAAILLATKLVREIEVRQGRGSLIRATPAEDGYVEIAGRVVRDPEA